jgi:hypothetical protein
MHPDTERRERTLATLTNFHRRSSDAALQQAAEKMRESFMQVARRELVADGVVITAMAEALAAVEAALAHTPAQPA